MRAVVQRVTNSSVTVDGEVIGQIGKGLLVLLGITHNDMQRDAEQIVDKIAGLRVFDDGDGKMNLSVKDVGGALLIVSQFTLYADTRRGRRPSFMQAAKGEIAANLCNIVIEKARREISQVEHGSFGAMMDVALVNDGPVTIILYTRP